MAYFLARFFSTDGPPNKEKTQIIEEINRDHRKNRNWQVDVGAMMDPILDENSRPPGFTGPF